MARHCACAVPAQNPLVSKLPSATEQEYFRNRSWSRWLEYNVKYPGAAAPGHMNKVSKLFPGSSLIPVNKRSSEYTSGLAHL